MTPWPWFAKVAADGGCCVQPVHYSTVPRGTERLRITPGPMHSEEMMHDLGGALVEIFDRLEIGLAA
jgi:5-aminolevulinate synthase